VIKKVLRQQDIRFRGGEVKGLIVSIDKSYSRPIVRGKKNKRVEFGAKVNTIRNDSQSRKMQGRQSCQNVLP